MLRRILTFVIFSIFAATGLTAQQHEHGWHPLVIRGEVWVDLEPIFAGHVDEEYPLSMNTAGRRALEEAAMLFSAMIYGWSFNYEIGERARQIGEHFELHPVGSILFGDPGLRVTEAEVIGSMVRMWADYHLSETQQRRMHTWRTGNMRTAQALGFYAGNPEIRTNWLDIRKGALEDAARAATRAMLQGSERNRPREAHGFISLASFPRFYIDRGRMAVSARFRVQITEIIPFSVH